MPETQPSQLFLETRILFQHSQSFLKSSYLSTHIQLENPSYGGNQLIIQSCFFLLQSKKTGIKKFISESFFSQKIFLGCKNSSVVKCLLLLQRTRVQNPALILWLTVYTTSALGDPMPSCLHGDQECM